MISCWGLSIENESLDYTVEFLFLVFGESLAKIGLTQFFLRKIPEINNTHVAKFL